ncbi:bifunctional proline dehydrogenase/L-glutamate gamma-semialdehyde dehydrogenase PutA [Amphritea sp. HPY]|uniref:bifunctional proline dehydrogenase/L-glutamate gamma-semialdehyde dehydrogenase PutA n=1 Tax=Amphritea sp. HPY TaxID=3421652 RepID=UPI003D7D5FA1
MFPLSLYFSDQQVKWTANQLWANIPSYYCYDEVALTEQLLELHSAGTSSENAADHCQSWVRNIREETEQQHYLDQFLKAFSLETDEGIVLMSLAETLLRIPDKATADALIEDKLTSAQWQLYLADENPVLLNTSVWGLAISQHLISAETSPDSIFERLINRISRPVIRTALTHAMQLLGDRFVFAPDIQGAMQRIHDLGRNQTCSFDMLGEAAVCSKDAKHYFSAYLEAIETVGQSGELNRPLPSVSIKLSALHPRFEPLKQPTVVKEVVERMLHLIITARQYDVQITIDAEESSRHELTLQVFAELFSNEICRNWGGLGIAVQAYSKRALPTLGWLSFLASESQTAIPVRLVKGAYWDSEIKLAQQAALPDYPVYTLKPATDLSYQVCANFILSQHCPNLIPQFATHNAQTISYLLQSACDPASDSAKTAFEFQRLHGVGEAIYQQALSEQADSVLRVYAPVGVHQQLLPYLVRRLLENGANSSFVLQQFNTQISTRQICTPPALLLQQQPGLRNQTIPLPADLYQPLRHSARGQIIDSSQQREQLFNQIAQFEHKQWHCTALIHGEAAPAKLSTALCSPYDLSHQIGQLCPCDETQVREAYSVARTGFISWNATPLIERVAVIKRFAGLLEENSAELIALCIAEAGKSITDSIAELREAIDFCHYYATQAMTSLKPVEMPSITGELNILSYEGRGIFVCISPWNFPLAIWTGQVVAALICGNSVLSKPASATPLIAYRATELLLEAGLPADAISLLPGKSEQIGEVLTGDFRLAGVAFTGSTGAAATIAQQVNNRPGAPIIPLIAETGGQNAMIVDSTALPEQVVKDVLHSAFNSAGQRCSALRVLYLQEDTAEQIEALLIGAMNTLKIGMPSRPDTDIGPVIDHHALNNLHGHIEHCRHQGLIIHELELREELNVGYFVPPTLIRLHSINELNGEHFGPILHIIRYQADNLERIIDEINRTGYGLTLGVHSRNSQIINRISQQARVGNIYINRNQVGAVVSSQPFGGMGLSGTGPKAGGPNYLMRFVQEKTISTNTVASGGNQQLFNNAYQSNR